MEQLWWDHVTVVCIGSSTRSFPHCCQVYPSLTPRPGHSDCTWQCTWLQQLQQLVGLTLESDCKRLFILLEQCIRQRYVQHEPQLYALQRSHIPPVLLCHAGAASQVEITCQVPGSTWWRRQRTWLSSAKDDFASDCKTECKVVEFNLVVASKPQSALSTN